MQNMVFILNEAPYGSEKCFNALRLALNLKKKYGDDVYIKFFLMSDAVFAGLSNQRPAEGYNIQRLFTLLLEQGAEIKLCTTCIADRGIDPSRMIEGLEAGSMINLASWSMEADKVFTF
ncbi:hypothetical protein CI610_02091 [invertebrate metagenome]|uniref:Uncharacterized protein n=1 Tax=invertebrate metagenome TaxID=1711999 RepID=A0A2H9T6W7_9ZZZZ